MFVWQSEENKRKFDESSESVRFCYWTVRTTVETSEFLNFCDISNISVFCTMFILLKCSARYVFIYQFTGEWLSGAFYVKFSRKWKSRCLQPNYIWMNLWLWFPFQNFVSFLCKYHKICSVRLEDKTKKFNSNT